MSEWDGSPDESDPVPLLIDSPPAKNGMSEAEMAAFARVVARMESDLLSLKERLHGVKTTYTKKRNPILKAWITNNLLTFTALCQFFCVLILHFTNQSAMKPLVTGIVFVVLLNAVQLLFIIATTWKLSKQIQHHTASNWFLASSYLSTSFLFAGLYMLTFRLQPQGFSGIDLPTMTDPFTHNGTDAMWHQQNAYGNAGAYRNTDGYGNTGGTEHRGLTNSTGGEALELFVVYIRFWYFSVSTMSSTGFGDIHTNTWWSDLLCIVEMLMGVLYSTAILSSGIRLIALSKTSHDGEQVQDEVDESVLAKRRSRFIEQ